RRRLVDRQAVERQQIAVEVVAQRLGQPRQLGRDERQLQQRRGQPGGQLAGGAGGAGADQRPGVGGHAQWARRGARGRGRDGVRWHGYSRPVAARSAAGITDEVPAPVPSAGGPAGEGDTARAAGLAGVTGAAWVAGSAAPGGSARAVQRWRAAYARQG